MNKSIMIRICYGIIAILVFIILIYNSDYFLTDPKPFDWISYIGTIITIIGLPITLGEVFYSISIAKSIKKQSEKILNQFKSIDTAGNIKECTNQINLIIKYITRDEYALANDNFLNLRGILVKIIDIDKDKLDQLESDVESLTSASDLHQVSKNDKQNIKNALRKIKSALEKKYNEELENATK